MIGKCEAPIIRPIRLTLGDFMKIYSPDNMTISVMDNASNYIWSQNLDLMLVIAFHFNLKGSSILYSLIR